MKYNFKTWKDGYNLEVASHKVLHCEIHHCRKLRIESVCKPTAPDFGLAVWSETYDAAKIDNFLMLVDNEKWAVRNPQMARLGSKIAQRQTKELHEMGMI